MERLLKPDQLKGHKQKQKDGHADICHKLSDQFWFHGISLLHDNSLTDKIRIDNGHLRRQGEQFAAYIPAFQKIRHIVAQDLHSLNPFPIFPDLLRGCSMYHIPITRRNNRHLHQAEIFIHLVPGSRSPCPPGGNDCRGRLQVEPFPAAV